MIMIIKIFLGLGSTFEGGFSPRFRKGAFKRKLVPFLCVFLQPFCWDDDGGWYYESPNLYKGAAQSVSILVRYKVVMSFSIRSRIILVPCRLLEGGGCVG